MQIWLYVKSIEKVKDGALVTATNGGHDGPPSITFLVPGVEGNYITLHDRFKITIDKET